MNTPSPRSLLRDDTRAVAPVIGFILIFGILFVAFAGYQATTVPQQNQAAEFDHLQEVENDLVDVRRAILRSGQSDVREFATVQLGMRYPTRLIALNPPQPTGTLRTSDPYDIRIEKQDDSTDRVDVATRFLIYEPGYNELPSTPVRYENSVLYREAENNVIIEDQELVTDEGTLEITALQNQLREQGTGRITVSLYPTEEFTADEIPDGEIRVTIPTRLDEGYWDDAIGDTEFDDNNFRFEENEYPDGVNATVFELDTEETDLKLNTVGIQSEPEEEGREPLKQGVGGIGNGNGNRCVLGDRTVTEDSEEDIAVEGDISIESGVEVNGDVTAGGDVEVSSGARIFGNVLAGGDVSLESGSRIDGDVDYGDDLTVPGGAQVTGETTDRGDNYSPCA